ncbi:MAG TPA: DUF559 domain-containing protein [Candidatus Thermoplasmatota archaeon]|nr:DUF559 domain-containing protein [Candidatus Thermoplasmatota archaeon]
MEPLTGFLVGLGVAAAAAAAVLGTRYLLRKPAPAEAPEAKPVPTLRSKGGLAVRSRGELMIANYLEAKGVPFEYEAKVAGYTPDFYVREHRLIIEYWGLIGHRHYDLKRAKKLERYKAEGYRVIGLTPRTVQNLSLNLGKKLKKYFPEQFQDL